MKKSDRQKARDERYRRQRPALTFEPAPEIADRLDLLAYERARLLHVADPGEPLAALCGRDGEPECIGGLAGRRPEEICKGCRELALAIVVVKKPDPRTGEILVDLVAPDRYKREEERPVVSRRFRERVLAGEQPALIWPRGECPVQTGDVIPLSSKVSIEIGSIGFVKGSGDDRAAYRVIDDRPVLVRRTPPLHEPPELDHRGRPKILSPGEEEATRIASGYTQDPAQAIPSGAQEVDVDFRRVISARKRTKDAERQKEEDPMAGTEEDIRRAGNEIRELAKRSVKMGLDPTEVLAPIFKSIKDAHAGLNDERGEAAS